MKGLSKFSACGKPTIEFAHLEERNNVQKLFSDLLRCAVAHLPLASSVMEKSFIL